MSSLNTMFAERLRRFAADAGLELSTTAMASLAAYAGLIEKWNRTTNLVSNADTETLVVDHVGDCLTVTPLLRAGAIADCGSGAGLPGIVIAIMRPDIAMTLVERRRRKARFLTQVAIELGLPNVQVAAQRIEQWRPATALAGVICRGYSSLENFLRDTHHLHHAALRVYAMKGRLEADDVASVRARGAEVQVTSLSVPGRAHRHLVEVTFPNE